MSNAITCPSDEELIPMLVGESADPSVASHLHGCSACRRRLELFQSDLNALRSVSIDVPEFVPPPSRPSRIGKYLVVGTLDSGGQADVYRAIHPTLDKELAIKLSRHAVGRLSDHRPLLVAEGKLLAKLDHPGLARVYDLDFHDDLPFLAMEYVRGPNLKQFATEVPVSPRTAAEIVNQVARALAVVHRHGIVHQDVKPNNILIDETGRPRLIDFGMARLRHAWDDSGDRATGGTPAFMAPEQARSEETPIRPRCDVFGLGGVLYFLLTGKPPFQGGTLTDTLERAGRCEFDRAALDRPGVPRRLRDICLKAMAANPTDRFPRADDFAEALEHHLARPQRLQRIGLLSVAAAVVVGYGVFAWTRPKPDPAPVTVNKPDQPATPPALEVTVSRGGKVLDLPAALPLQPNGDQVQVIGRVSPGHQARLLHLNTKGAVKELPVRESPADNYMRLVFPQKEGELATFEPGESGTEFLLLVASEKPETLEVLRDLVMQYLTQVRTREEKPVRESRLPVLPPTMLVWLGRDEPTRQQMGLRDGQMDNTTRVVDRLDELRQRLREMPLSTLRGVAYPR